MEETFRVSVRDLVSFSFFPADITPSGDPSVLLTGTRAHQARQAEAGGRAEQTVKRIFEVDGIRLLLFGRIDAFTDGAVPLVEEIKLGTQAGDLLEEHRAQAVCYAAMVALEKPCEHVRVRVCYVDAAGAVLRQYEETLSAMQLQENVLLLLTPYAAFAAREAAHRHRRDESLLTLPFPFQQYRTGQRELAVQVYTAITRKKRLFATLPTGTGKSAAVLYPALKALGEGKTGKLVYLTSRNTARQSPLSALTLMMKQGLKARCTVLTAKETLCPAPTRCHPDFCPRARGHYLRQEAAVAELLQMEHPLWTDEVITAAADLHNLCPFELAVTLTTLADVLLMDLNYVFDPFAQMKRLPRNSTLLVDEAHHCVDRVRESLSGSLHSGELRRLRAAFGKVAGRSNPFYRSLSALIHALCALAPNQSERFESRLSTPPDDITALAQEAMVRAGEQLSHALGMGEAVATLRLCLAFLYAAEHLDEDYAILLEGHGRERCLTLYCLLPGKEIARQTKARRGAVFFSATLSPLSAMKRLLGGEEADACFSLPSPFPTEHLAVIRRRIDTRYHQREQSAQAIAQVIGEAVRARPGSYIAFFPSYAYLSLVLDRLDENTLPPLWVQRRVMTDGEREAFLAEFMAGGGARLGLCVLGGLFSEGIDLPGSRLIGAIIVGVGLPTPSARLNAIQDCYQRHFGDGYAYACRIPAMHKVLQAAGRVIRSESDRGMVLLLDDRYYQPEYESLLPPEWRLESGDIRRAARKLEE